MKIVLTLGLVLSACTAVQAQNLETPAPRPDPPLPYSATVDPAIPAYKPVKGLAGTLKGVESNTVTIVQQKWIDGFTKIYPNVKISVDIGGSGQGGPRLTNGSPGGFALPWKFERHMFDEVHFPKIICTSVVDWLSFVTRTQPVSMAGSTFSPRR